MGEPLRAFHQAVAADDLDEERIRELLDAAAEAGRAAFPGVDVGEEELARFLGERAADEADPVGSLQQRCLDDLFLACACLRSQPAALAAFERSCLAHVTAAVRRIAHTDEMIDEVRQMTRVSLLVGDDRRAPKLAGYRGTGKLRSWVQVAAVRIALDLRRRHRPEEPGDDDDRLLQASSELDDDPELVHIRHMYRSEFAEAFKQAMRELSSRERNVLRMYLVDGLNIDQIGNVYGVHRATVARWIARSREELLAGTRERLALALRLNDRQFESLMRVVRSHLDLSVERLLVDVSHRSRGPG